jgi:hypothetical protein
MFKKMVVSLIKALLWILDPLHRQKHVIDHDYKKFTHMWDVDFKSDFGTVKKILRTVPYEAWLLRTSNRELIAADKHLVIAENNHPTWIKDLKINDRIITENGVENVIECRSLDVHVHMYDIEVTTDNPNDPMNHLYYSNGILSHNTTCAAGFLLWKAMFEPDQTILVVANKMSQAMEVMDRIRFAYENMDQYNWLRAGSVEYNKQSIKFDNGSEIICRATTADAGRGLSISLLYCLAGDTNVTVRNKHTGEEQVVSLMELESLLQKKQINN